MTVINNGEDDMRRDYNEDPHNTGEDNRCALRLSGST